MYKTIEINKRSWRVGKFDARTGSKIIKKLLPIVSTFFDGNAKKAEDIKIDIVSVVSAINTLSDSDFDFIQGESLKISSELLKSGYVPVMNNDGSYGVIDIEFDTMLVLTLTAHALIHNVTGFFSGSPLASIVDKAMSTLQPTTPT